MLSERIRKHSKNGQRKYPSINLPDNLSRTIHRLLAELWIPNPLGHPDVLHKDDNPQNYSLDNLYWGTDSENRLDAVRNGLHHYSKRTHCNKGHEYTEENISWYQNGRARRCNACRRERYKASKER